jgi:coenzyme PQQ precursor peptide PqqA
LQPRIYQAQSPVAPFFPGSIDFTPRVGYANHTFAGLPAERLLGEIMEWTAPAFEEVCLNCEINSYASAKL